jgi:sulfotransferase
MRHKTVHFLSGLPRTGSTLLGSILAQNPRIHVTPTSPLYSLLVNANEHLNLLNRQYTFDQVAVGNRIYPALVEAVYADIAQPIIFDKHRGWPKHVPSISAYINAAPTIICTVRPIAEIITSYLVLAEADPSNFIDAHLRTLDQPMTNESRAHLLWSSYLTTSYESLAQGLRTHPEQLLLVEYRDLVCRPAATLARLYEFCGLDSFEHRWTGIENRCAEAKDEAWGLKNLHTIRPTLGMQSTDPRAYLPRAAIEYFEQFDVGVRR